jgi:hypothetical protein
VKKWEYTLVCISDKDMESSRIKRYKVFTRLLIAAGKQGFRAHTIDMENNTAIVEREIPAQKTKVRRPR